jgi:hypothetical protein
LTALPQLDLRLSPVTRRPFPHVLRDGFIRPDLYRELQRTFPDCPPSSGPSGHGLFWGDAGHEALLASSPAWRELFDAVQGQAFVDYALTQFADVIGAECLVDLARARYVRHQENREEKERQRLPAGGPRQDELWVRHDIHRAHRGYDRGIHLDHRRRLISMLIYFCDAREARMVGGNLILERSASGWPPWGRRSIHVRHNRMVAFPCAPSSFHAVPPVLFSRQHRKFVQIQISSRADLWREPPRRLTDVAVRSVTQAPPLRAVRRAASTVRRTLASLRHGSAPD